MASKQPFERKCLQMLVGQNTKDSVSINVDGCIKHKSDTEKLLGVKFDKKLSFDNQISDICKNEGTNISALAMVRLYIGIAKKHILMNAFFQLAIQLLSSSSVAPQPCK